MTISPTHKLITIQSDPLLESARNDNKRDRVIALHSIVNAADTVMVCASSES